MIYVYGRSDLDSWPVILLFLVPVAVKVGSGPPLMGRIVKADAGPEDETRRRSARLVSQHETGVLRGGGLDRLSFFRLCQGRESW